MKLIKWPQGPQKYHKANGYAEDPAHVHCDECWETRDAPHTYHWCPACEKLHVLPDAWAGRGPDEAPTYAPSFLQHERKGACHYVITDGFLQFHSDSWHRRTDRVAMPDIPQSTVDRLTDAVFER